MFRKGKFGTINDIYKKKCGYEEIPFNSNCPPLKWGVKYEPVRYRNIFCKK